MAKIGWSSNAEGVNYLDEIQDEAYERSSLHGDAWVETEAQRPVREVSAEQVISYNNEYICLDQSDTLFLSGVWKMKGCPPSDPGDPPPATGWFGRKASASPGMEGRWYAEGTDRSGWDEVRVPTTVQHALVQLGRLPDPYWDTNTLDELELFGAPQETPVWFRRTRAECQEWWFATAFTLPGRWQGRKLTLRFGGIDYAATVFVNGCSLGHHAGMFGGPDLDISGLAKYGQPNELVVRLDPAPQSWNGILKGSPGFGWHYGHLISLGIWREVWIEAEPDLKAADPYVVTRSISPDEALLQIEYSVVSLLPDPVRVSVEGEIRLMAPPASASVSASPGNGEFAEDSHPLRFRCSAEASYGANRFRTEVTVPNPALWWPAGYGGQPLYELVLTLLSGQSEQEGGVSTVFGIRTLEMRPAAEARPETDYRWQFVVNGVPLFIKGANWCWPDPMLQQDPALYERMLELARRGNVQMLRAWGGGLIEGQEFYRLCDAKGIMVYQEFPLCWGPPDAPYTDLGVLDRQVSRTVKQLRNHPSLVMWGGGNENGEHGGADEGLFLVGRRCRGLDPSRPFHRTDPWGGSVHNWNVYHGGEPLDAAVLAMPSVFYGEYGIPSMPGTSSIRRFLPEKALSDYPPSETSRGWLSHFHQFGLKDIIKVMRYGAYGPIRSWEDYILYSQIAQGEAIRLVADRQRAGTGSERTGFWYYKFTDLFPGHSWAVVDFYGTPKLSYYLAAQACKSDYAFALFERADSWKTGEHFSADLMAVSDTREGLSGGSLDAALYGADLKKLWSKTYEGLELPGGQALLVDRVTQQLPPGTSDRPFVLATALRARDGRLLSEQWYAFNARAKTPELLEFERSHRQEANEYTGDEAAKAFQLYAGLPGAPLRALPQAELECTLEVRGQTGTLLVRNTGEVPALFVTIKGFPEDWGSYLDDNGFGLRPGDEKEISWESANKTGWLSCLEVSAWNAASVQPAVSGGNRSIGPDCVN
ncbi:glycosyl hydrolase 2 galactose-binding domain-containing protein [Paenibacillus sp. CN-4]|uniref:glycoside hydrolase family 2 protein n=1 Tax=Paenibacillus nanchangensis TaxID=3348343 RepID=UPI00397A424A